MSLLLDPATWASLVTLTALEIILGVDNIVVLSILTHSLSKGDARRARSIGLGLALGLRLLLLSAITWITRLTYPVLSVFDQQFSWRDFILIGGGLFLMVKATQEIHAEIEGGSTETSQMRKAAASFGVVISQIAVTDLVFSLDSIITAVGLARDIEVMAAAICIAVAIMYFAAEPVGDFIRRHPTAKMLALCFLILIGVALIVDGFGLHIPRGYIYFAMAFAGIVETFNIWAKQETPQKSASSNFESRPRPLRKAEIPRHQEAPLKTGGDSLTASTAVLGKKSRRKKPRKKH